MQTTNQLLILSHSNNENLSPELHRLEDTEYELHLTEINLIITHINRSMHAAFHACALQGKLQRPSSGCFDLLRLLFRGYSTLNQHCTNTRYQFFRKVQSALEEIGNDDRLRASSSSRQQRDQSDRPSATTYVVELINTPKSYHETCKNQWAYQMRTGSPRRRSARSIPAKATARGSQSAPSSKDTSSGRR